VKTREPLTISSVDHKSFLRVNEAGAEAAAATSVSIAVRSMPMERVQPHITLDRPFFFVLRDVDSGCVFFAGTMANPQV
jgi:serine protease inhibitor